jgi:hypothetical protein
MPRLLGRIAVGLFAAAVLCFGSVGAALAGIGSITITSLPGGNIKVSMNHSGYTASAGLGTNLKYRICFKPANRSGATCTYRSFTNDYNPAVSTYPSNENGVVTDVFYGGVTYLVSVSCRCKPSSGGIYQYREVEAKTFTYSDPAGGSFRLRGVAAGKCAYVDPNGPLLRNWTCYPDPAMVFVRSDAGQGTVFLTQSMSGKCIQVPFPVIGGGNDVRVNTCGSGLTQIIVVDIGGGQVQLKTTTNRCLFASPSDGGIVQVGACSSDSKFTFVLDPA